MWVRILLPLQTGWLRILRVINRQRANASKLPAVNKKITMSKIGTYVRESYKELTTKVTWPTWDKLQSSAILVMVVTIILAAVIWAIDFVIKTLMTGLYQL